MEVVISKKELRTYGKLKVISEIAPIQERIKMFERMYNCSLEDFEKRLKKREEDFEAWDEYIEWKAYVRTCEELKRKLKEIENAEGIRIA